MKPLSVLVFAPLPVGPLRTGPTVRALAIARSLAREFDVTLAVPNGSVLEPPQPFAVCRWTRKDAGRLIRSFDIAVSQGTAYPAHACVTTGRRTVQVFDLYDPLLYEQENAGGAAGHIGRLTSLLLARADLVLCASPEQRDLWAGGLYVSGRSSGGPRLEVVPFGHDGVLPPAGPPALKGAWPGIGADDRVLLWGGGLWDWFDIETLLDALARLSARRGDLRLFVLGARHPDVGGEIPRDRLNAAIRRRGLGRIVVVNDGWVPFDERHRYLREADLVVCTAPAGPEARFSFRARLVDAVWAGVPAVTTRGGAMARFVRQHRIGAVVPPSRAGALADAIDTLLAPEQQRRCRRAIAACRPLLAWERCLRPLHEFCRGVAAGDYRRAAEPPWRAWAQYAGYKVPSWLERRGWL